MAVSTHYAQSGLGKAARARTAAPQLDNVPLFRFGLRQVFWVTALVSVLLACIVSADGITASVILLASLVVAAHVFSTSLSSRLRDRSDEQHVWRGPNSSHDFVNADGGHVSGDSRAMQTNPRSPWHGRGSTHLPWLRRLTISGAVAGGAVGAFILLLAVGHRASFAGILLGSLSLGVLGGWFSFVGGSFYGIFRHGLHEALANERRNEGAQPVR